MHDPGVNSRRRTHRPFARALAVSFFALAGLAIPRRAHALVNIGPEGGLVERSADSPNNLKLGFGYGAHAELDLLPLLKMGPYYLHSSTHGGGPAPLVTSGDVQHARSASEIGPAHSR